MNKVLAKVLAIVACIFIYFLYMIFCSAMGFKHGGGILVVLILVAIMRAVWKAINKMADKPKAKNSRENSVSEAQSEKISVPTSVNVIDEAPMPEPEIPDSELPPIPMDDVPISAVEEKSIPSKVVIPSSVEMLQPEEVKIVDIPVESEHNETVEQSSVVEESLPEDKPVGVVITETPSPNVSPTSTTSASASMETPNKVLVVCGSIILSIAVVCMIVSMIEFQIIWNNYAADNLYWFDWYTICQSCLSEMIIYVLLSLIATIVLSVQYAIFRHTKSSTAVIAWGTIEIIIGLCTLPSLLSAIVAISFGTVYVIHGLKNNYI